MTENVEGMAPEAPENHGAYEPQPPRRSQELVHAQRVVAGTVVPSAVAVAVEPTQMRRPWRATIRTAFAALVAIAALLPFIVEASGLDPEVYPWLGGILAVAAGVTRVMALPQVEAFLKRFLPFLAAAPK